MKLNRHTDRDDVNHGVIQERTNIGVAIRNMKLIGNMFETSGIGIGQRHNLCVIKPT